MEEKNIIIDAELSNYIESLQYDIEGIKQLFEQMKPDTPKDIMDYWKEEYLTKFKEYTLAKQAIENAIKESGVVENNKSFSWNLNFATRKVTISQ